jgi:superfamily II DNA/RNA helicase
MAFSATISDKALNAAKSLMKEPSVFKVNEKLALNPNISHMYILCEKREKFEVLRKLITAVNLNKSIVFVNNNEEIELVADKLNFHKKNAGGIYGLLSKEDRKKTINDFRNGSLKILVSSDLSARGLDFPDIDYIINLDFPLHSSEYLHRAGRTARGLSSGTCISIVTDKELAAIRVYERDFNIKIEQIRLYEGRIYKV